MKAAGPMLTILGFLIFPILWSVPEALITAELATAFPENRCGTHTRVCTHIPVRVSMVYAVASMAVLYVDGLWSWPRAVALAVGGSAKAAVQRMAQTPLSCNDQGKESGRSRACKRNQRRNTARPHASQLLNRTHTPHILCTQGCLHATGPPPR